MKLNLLILLVVLMFGYSLNANRMVKKQNNIIANELFDLRAEYDENKEQILTKIQQRSQRIMDIYGTRLTIVEKAVKRYHDAAILEDIVGPQDAPRKKG